MSETVNSRPTKSFFVTMFTRDVELHDAILDLIDNSLDGAMRQIGRKALKRDSPFDGYECRVDFDGTTFSIEDNCGGIPRSVHDYAFRMGRPADVPSDHLPTVGTYGVGMKRAIFKFGRSATLQSHHEGERGFKITYRPAWLDSEEDWELELQADHGLKDFGTRIRVMQLHPGVAESFGKSAKAFESELFRRISGHYAFMIQRGFRIVLNRKLVPGKPVLLAFSEGGKSKMAPFVYQREIDGVTVRLTVGMTSPIPDDAETDRSEESTNYKSLEAGWTVVCNDRAVLYCDRTELTGWGEAGVPSYHTQFISISGIVEFTAEDASKLPTTTTKRGLDLSSKLYLQVKNKMREGLKLFTAYTNRWRGRFDEAREHLSQVPLVSPVEIHGRVKMTKVADGGRQYRPELPRPVPTEDDFVRMSFSRRGAEVKRVSRHLGLEDVSPNDVAAECFDVQAKRAHK